ncbi:MAG: hypothetical protein Q8P38_08885 [Candidatus Nanopelagicales bacterium]|nr:hypothetical protein [Candidatus Nanopelagicales bacterium]
MGRSRAGRWVALVVGIVLVGAVGACSSPQPEPFPQQAGVPPPSEVWPTPDVWPSDDPVPAIVGDPVKLSTKCGIQFLQAKGKTWETSPFGGGPPAKWGNGGPPPGWPMPEAKGRVIPMGDVLLFTSVYEPSPLRFHLTTRTPPPCP